MSSLRFSTPRHAQRAIAIAILALLASIALAAASPAAAQDAERVELGVKPVGVDGSYFELTMSPGDARQLTVAFSNFGTQDAVAMTYPADVYSLVNGGMGVRLAGEPVGETTGWLGFDGETMPLAAGEAQLRTFAVSVPEDAAPGEYITSVVIQDTTPAEESAADGVVANRVNRQAIAVAITVPGPIAPGLTLGAIEHHVAGGRSIITVEVENSGNVRLQPQGELVLSAVSGGEPAHFPVVMDSVYAGTSTVAEIPFATLLEPGDYTAVLSLTDMSQTVAATTPRLSVSVPVFSTPLSVPASAASLAALQNQPEASDDNTSMLPAVAFAAGAIALALAGFVVAKKVLPRVAARPVASAAAAVPVGSSAGAGLARPVTIRQLDVPRRPHLPTPDEPQPRAPRFRKLDVPQTSPRFATTATRPHTKGA